MKKVEEIEVIDPIIVTPQSNVERFYKWMQKCKNQYINDSYKMTRAFNIVACNS